MKKLFLLLTIIAPSHYTHGANVVDEVPPLHPKTELVFDLLHAAISPSTSPGEAQEPVAPSLTQFSPKAPQRFGYAALPSFLLDFPDCHAYEPQKATPNERWIRAVNGRNGEIFEEKSELGSIRAKMFATRDGIWTLIKLHAISENEGDLEPLLSDINDDPWTKCKTMRTNKNNQKGVSCETKLVPQMALDFYEAAKRRTKIPDQKTEAQHNQ